MDTKHEYKKGTTETVSGVASLPVADYLLYSNVGDTVFAYGELKEVIRKRWERKDDGTYTISVTTG